MNIYLKALIFLLIYAFLHLKCNPHNIKILRSICIIDESIFQHIKLGFWSYIFTNAIEYFIDDVDFRDIDIWLFPRLFSSSMIPWLMIVIWYLAPALFDRIRSLIKMILWDIFATYLSGVFATLIENSLSKNLSSEFKMFILIFLATSIFLYIRFTYKRPSIDLFNI